MPPAVPQLTPLVNTVVAPGDAVLSLAAFAASASAGAAGGGAAPGAAPPALRLGASLLQLDGDVVATRGGTLRQTGGGKLWVEASQKRYIPAPDDAVVGVVTERHAEARRVTGAAARRAPARVAACAAARHRRCTLRVRCAPRGRGRRGRVSGAARLTRALHTAALSRAELCG
jgi:hypothetical protein